MSATAPANGQIAPNFSGTDIGRFGTERPLQTVSADPSANSFTVHGKGVQMNLTWTSLLLAGLVIAGGCWYLSRKK